MGKGAIQIAVEEPMGEEKRLLELDREWNEAYPRRDVAALGRVIADDWVCIDGAGRVIGKRQLLDRVESSASFLDPYRFDEIVLRMFDGAAIVTGRLSGEGPDDDGGFYLEQRYTRVYVKRGDCWQCVATQVTVVKQERLMKTATPDNSSDPTT
jgi:ketosteroid isomerase-like protein